MSRPPPSSPWPPVGEAHIISPPEVVHPLAGTSASDALCALLVPPLSI